MKNKGALMISGWRVGLHDQHRSTGRMGRSLSLAPVSFRAVSWTSKHFFYLSLSTRLNKGHRQSISIVYKIVYKKNMSMKPCSELVANIEVAGGYTKLYRNWTMWACAPCSRAPSATLPWRIHKPLRSMKAIKDLRIYIFFIFLQRDWQFLKC